MGFARVGAPKENNVRLFHFAIRAGAASRAENRRQTGDARGVSSPVATIDVVAADDGTDEFLCRIVQLVGSFGAAKHAKGARAVLANFPADTLRNAIQSFFPCCRTMLSVFAK
jgi:hypothetical protein